MRFHYANLTRPKAAAKSIARLIDGVSLSKAQAGLAMALGYRDWHDLECAHAAAAPTPLDQALPECDAAVRIADLAIRLADALDLYTGDAAVVLARSHATGDLPLDDWLTRAIADSLDGLAPWPRSRRGRLRLISMAELCNRTRPMRGAARRAEPSRLCGQIPLPPRAKAWLDPLVDAFERSEDCPVLHAYYRDHGETIRVLFRVTEVVDGQIVDTEAWEVGQFKKADLDWTAGQKIAQRARLPGFRAARVLAGLKKAA